MAKGRVFQAELSDDDIDELMILADKEILNLSCIIDVYGDNPEYNCGSMKRRLQRITKVRETLGEIRQ